MKRMIGIVVAAVVMAGVAAVDASDACCASSKAKAEGQSCCSKGQSGCAAFSGLKLSDEQQGKIDALVKECQGTKCSETSEKKFMAGVKGILTAEQFTQWQAQCEKAKKSGSCPVTGKTKTETYE